MPLGAGKPYPIKTTPPENLRQNSLGEKSSLYLTPAFATCQNHI
jgi:hypothetical protein